MLNIIKKVIISLLAIYMCITPLAQIQDIGYVQSATESITREVAPNNNPEQSGFKYYIHVGNVTYTHYYQIKGDYKNMLFPGSNKTIYWVGCLLVSCATLLSGYGQNVSPAQIVSESGGSFESGGYLASKGVPGTLYKNRTQQEYIALMDQAFSEGKPVIVKVVPKATTYWTGQQHFMTVVGQDENYLWVCDPAHTDDGHQMYSGKIQGIVKDMETLWIPNSAPAGGNGGNTYVPSQGGDDPSGGGAVDPGNGKIPVTWEIGEEIPDLDNLGDFRYKGNPKEMTYNGKKKPLEWVFSLISSYIDYILGMMFTVTKIVIVGTIENIENLINGMILDIEEIDEDIHYTIEDVVYNRIPILDPNILSGKAGGMEVAEGSRLDKIKDLIASWYVSFRNISVLIVFVMLIYTGLKMAITTSIESKADCKQQLFTWVKCLAMLFLMHYIIFLVLNINNTLVELFDPSNNTEYENILYNTIKTRAYDLRLSIGFTGTVMYIVLFIYWIKFLIIYTKRLFKIILLIVTAPFVIGRYALDNANGKGKKAYRDWLHDFVTNVCIQTIHALEYTLLIGVAVDIATKSIAGFIIALIFLSKILKFDEIILSIFKFDGEDTGKRIKPLKEPLPIKTYLNYKYAQVAIKTTGKAVKTVGNGVSKVGGFVNNRIKDATDVDIAGTVREKKDAVLDKKDDLLKATIGKISEERNEVYELRKTTRERDENGKLTNRAKTAKKVLVNYKKEKNKRYKLQREQYVKSNRVLSTMRGVGKLTIGTALMTQNLTTGALMVGLSPKEIKDAIIEHDARQSEYNKNNKKIDELRDTVKTVNKVNKLEDNIQEELEEMEPEQREKAIKELMALSSLNGNTSTIDDAIQDYMTRRGIKIINNDNIDEIMEAVYETVDPSKKLSAVQREQFKKELKNNLQIKRAKEWKNFEEAAKDAEERGIDEKGRTTKPSDSQETATAKEEMPQKETKKRRTISDWEKEREKTQEERIKHAEETYMTHYTRQEVANIFSQTVQANMVSQANIGLAKQVVEMQDLGYKYMKQNNKKLKGPNKFLHELSGQEGTRGNTETRNNRGNNRGSNSGGNRGNNRGNNRFTT